MKCLRIYFGWLLIIWGKKGLKVKLPVKRNSQIQALGRMSFSQPGWWRFGPGNHPPVQETWQTCHLQAWPESHQSLGLKTQCKRWHLELGFPEVLCMCARKLIAQPLLVATSRMTHNEVWNWAIKLRPLRDLKWNNKTHENKDRVWLPCAVGSRETIWQDPVFSLIRDYINTPISLPRHELCKTKNC